MPAAGASVVSLAGLFDATRFLSGLVLLSLMPTAVARVFSGTCNGRVFFAVFTCALLALSLFLQLSTSSPDMSDPIQSSRYLIPSFLLLLVLTLTHKYNFRSNPILTLAYLFVCTILVFGAYNTYVRSDVYSDSWGQVGQRQSGAMELVEFLKENGLRYGYASYWNAGKLSVLSDEAVLVRQVGFRNGIPVPMRHLSSDRWYKTGTWEGETFLLLQDHELSALNLDVLAVYQGYPSRELVFETFYIFVFPKNIALGTAFWDENIENELTFSASTHSNFNIGRYVPGDTGEIVAEKGEAGALHYGPYLYVGPGDYRVTFQVLSGYNAKGAIRLDVAGPNQYILAERTLYSENGNEVLDFHLDEGTTVEFRALTLGTEKTSFEKVSIVRLHPLVD